MLAALKVLLFGDVEVAPTSAATPEPVEDIFHRAHLLGEDFDLLIAANALISHLVMTAQTPRAEATHQIIQDLRRYEFIVPAADDSQVAKQIGEFRTLLPSLPDIREIHDQVVSVLKTKKPMRTAEVIDLVIGIRKRLARQASSLSLSSVLPGTT